MARAFDPAHLGRAPARFDEQQLQRLAEGGGAPAEPRERAALARRRCCRRASTARAADAFVEAVLPNMRAARGRPGVGRDRLRRTAAARALGRGSWCARRARAISPPRRQRPRRTRHDLAGDRRRGARGHRAQGRGAVHAAARGAHRALARTGARAAAAGDARRARRASGWRASAMIRIHNSLSGAKEELQPITPGQLRMYVCGLTVYDYVHIGHARMLMVFDMVTRYLSHRGYAAHLRAQHHRHRRQDHPPCGRERRAHRGAHRALHRCDARGLRTAGHPAAGPRAARDAVRAAA